MFTLARIPKSHFANASRVLSTTTAAPVEAKKIVRELSRTSNSINELFVKLDKDQDGQLSKEDFDSAFRQIGLEELKQLTQSLSRNELSRQPSRTPVVAQLAKESVEEEEKVGVLEMLKNRFVITGEVAVSKIFPAGFGWQTASIIAENNFGFAADSAQFALTTGVGDGLGVLLGHSSYYALKKATVDSSINMKEQVDTGLLLGTAAIFSGTAWQPLVDYFVSTGCSFNQTAVGVTAGCGMAFYTGLRFGRALYSNALSVEPASYSNLKADAALSLSIGGATGAFVGTDVSFGDANWLRPVVGVEEGMSDAAGCVTAGASTALGFTAFQAAQNATYTQGKNWVD